MFTTSCNESFSKPQSKEVLKRVKGTSQVEFPVQREDTIENALLSLQVAFADQLQNEPEGAPKNTWEKSKITEPDGHIKLTTEDEPEPVKQTSQTGKEGDKLFVSEIEEERLVDIELERE